MQLMQHKLILLLVSHFLHNYELVNRLLGKDNDDAADSTTTLAQAGWEVGTVTDPSTAAATKGAYGLLYFGMPAANQNMATGTLAATFYVSGAAIYPSGFALSASSVGATVALGGGSAGMNRLIVGAGKAAALTDKDFRLILSQSDGTSRSYNVSMEESSPNFIRNVFNTNPQLGKFANERVVTSVESPNEEVDYWLGETFERSVQELIFDNSALTNYAIAMVPLMSESNAGPADRRTSYRDALSPWVISQDTSDLTGSYDANTQQKLFRFATLDGQGEYANRKLKISIDNINYSPNDNVDFGTFDVLLREASDSDLNPVVIERFSNCNLDPNSLLQLIRIILLVEITLQIHIFVTVGSSLVLTAVIFPNRWTWALPALQTPLLVRSNSQLYHRELTPHKAEPIT